jgi:hypothetical protein
MALRPLTREAPNPKHQIPGKSQTPKSQRSKQASEREFGNWRLGFTWDLKIGIWNFCTKGAFKLASIRVIVKVFRLHVPPGAHHHS